MKALTVSPADQSNEYWGHTVSEFQDDDVEADGLKITGTLKKFAGWETGPLAGEGYFLALKFSNLDASATGAKVGLVPSASGMDLQDLDADMDAVFKIADKDGQRLDVVVYNASNETKYVYDLSGLTLVDGE